MKQLQLLTLAFLFLFLGCSEDNSPISSTENEGVSFSYTLSGVHSQELMSRAETNVIAKMFITDLGNSTVDTVDWFVALDKETVTLTSNMTYVLEPGSYSLLLEVVDGNHKYVGQADQIINDADQVIIPLSVKPVIGDVDLNVTVSNLPKLTFQFPATELSALTDPKIGYTIDGGSEIIVGLSKVDGASDVYMDITEGVHMIALKLYDGATQIGKSKLSQESITISANGDITMDIIPLHGEVQVTIPIDGGAGTFNISIPAEVITEAGTLANLKTTLQLSSPRNGSLESDVVLTFDGTNYTGSVTFDPIAYDTAVATITFIDVAKYELLATALFSEVVLNESGASLNASIGLLRRAVISGNIQAVVGVNVFDENGNPVLGAEVYVDDVLVGLTGSAWGTDGYLKFYHTSGDYTLSVENSALSADSSVTFGVLGIHNILLVLDNPPATSPVTQVFGGNATTHFIRSDHTLWATGHNEYGQLGDGTANHKYAPVEIMSDVQSVDGGNSHNLILKNDNTLWTTGNNESGQLGDGTLNSSNVPVLITGDVKKIRSSTAHYSLFIKNDNTLWGMGKNDYGQLDSSTTTTRYLSPIQIMDNVKDASAGLGHTLILKTDNTLWGMGRNDYGQLGNGSTDDRQNLILIMSDVQAVSAGEYSSFILKTDNTLWSMGRNDFGQLGDGTETNRLTPVLVMGDVQEIRSFSYQSLVLKNDNTLWGMGLNANGQLGISGQRHSTPVQLMSDVTSFDIGWNHTVVQKNDNTVWVSGRNDYGQLGDGTTVSTNRYKQLSL
jgi:alpha-tubulin suppressor-like RCC1 family protein